MEDIFIAAVVTLAPVAFFFGLLATFLARSKRATLFVGVVIAAYLLVNFAFAIIDLSPRLGFSKKLLIGLGWTAPIAAAYVFVLGNLVRTGTSVTPIVLSTIGLHIVTAPIGLLIAIYLACYIGHDCL